MHIRWTTPAAQDLTSISDYISEREGPALARRVALAIFEHVDALTVFPRGVDDPAVYATRASW